MVCIETNFVMLVILCRNILFSGHAATHKYIHAVAQ